MPRILRTGGKLATVGGRLVLDAGGAPCCCGPGFAVKFVECCNADPVLWVDQALVSGCQGIIVGGICYRSTGQVERISALESAGVDVIRAFTAGDGCISGCFDPRCPTCATECCITAYMRGCLTTDPRRCCLLGSAYRLEYTETTTLLRTGWMAGFTIIDNGAQICIVYDPGIIEEYTETRTGTVIHTGTDALGNSCSGVQPTANQTYRRYGRRHVYDQLQVDAPTRRVIPINPRYEDIDERSQSDIPMFVRGELPDPLYLDTGVNDPLTGVPIGNGCNFSTTFDSCERAGTDLDPCPSPTNPLVRRTINTISGAWNCEGGSQDLHTVDLEYACTREITPNVRTTITHTRREWTIQIMSTTGCEVESCADLDPPPNGGGGLIGRPVGGCNGCRREPGL